MLKTIIILLAAIYLFSCTQEQEQKPVTIADLESRYTELNDLNDDLNVQRNQLHKLIREYNSSRSETEQFDITSYDTLMGQPERVLLKGLFNEEKDISYNGLLKLIVEKNNDIIQLNQKISDLNMVISSLEEKLPKAYVVKRGDTQYEIVRNFLMNEYGLDKKQARVIAWKTAMTDNLLPGNRIWLSYDKDNSIVGTYVTQGEAKIAPMKLEQIAKRRMAQLIEEKVRQSIIQTPAISGTNESL